MTDSKKRLIVRLHTICSKQGISGDDRREMYKGYGASSSKEMEENEIQDLINRITGKIPNTNNRTDLLRKRCLAVVFNYYKLKSMTVSTEYVKATLTRASGYKCFNAIPDSILFNLYNAFLDKNRNRISVSDIDNKVTGYLQSCN